MLSLLPDNDFLCCSDIIGPICAVAVPCVPVSFASVELERFESEKRTEEKRKKT